MSRGLGDVYKRQALKDCKVEICLDMQKILNTPNPKLLKDLQNAVIGLKEA